jgi:hypothetical protein
MAGILVGLLTSSRALAHRLDVSVDVTEGKVIVEARYNDGLPAREADVKVTDPDGNVLVEAKTDAKGTFRFTLAAIPEHVNVVVKTDDGHRGAVTVSREDLAGLAGAGEEHVHAGHYPSASEPWTNEHSSADRDNLHEIEAALARIETELHEIDRELEHLRKHQAGASFDRGLAGVGFILGLTGVAAYCLARRARQN